MKRIFYSILAVAAVMTACNKQQVADVEVPGNAGEEIILGVDDGFSVTTKATAVTTMPSSLYWGGTTGSGTSEKQKWTAASATVSSNKIATGKYQTATATSYNYYVANQNFTVPSTGAVTMTIGSSTADGNGTDVVSGHTTSATTSTSPSVTLNHIFARTGSLTLTASGGYTLSNVSWTIVGKGDINGTSGTYNMTTDAWTAASKKLATATAITSSSDMYLIPGTYTLSATYTLSKGDYTGTFTKEADVTLVKGKINNMSGTTTPDPAQGISISLSLTAWSNNAISGLSF